MQEKAEWKKMWEIFLLFHRHFWEKYFYTQSNSLIENF